MKNNTTISYEFISDIEDAYHIFNVEKAMFLKDKYFLSSIDFYKRAIKKESNKIFVARTNHGEIVGVSYFLISKKSVRFYSLATLKGFQTFNITKNIFNQFFELAEKFNKEYLFLEIREDNKGLFRNYTNMGFSIYKKLEGYYPNNNHGLRLIRKRES